MFKRKAPVNKEQAQDILESCIDVKGQTTVSLCRLCKVLNINPITKSEVKEIIESRKKAKR